MKRINISTKKYPDTYALVDDCDHEELNKYKWGANNLGKGRLYASRNIMVGKEQKTLLMHIAILGCVNGLEIDHKNGNALDNQRNNLRHCTHTENVRNTGPQKNNTSGFKGVCWDKRNNKWRAQIYHNGKLVYLGLFFCLTKAAKVYDNAAIKYHKEFANLNLTK